MTETVWNVADRKQLFIDDRFIASAEGIALTTNQPERQEIVLRGEHPWERAGVYATVIDDGEKVRLYRLRVPPAGRAYRCGIAWTRCGRPHPRWAGR